MAAEMFVVMVILISLRVSLQNAPPPLPRAAALSVGVGAEGAAETGPGTARVRPASNAAPIPIVRKAGG